MSTSALTKGFPRLQKVFTRFRIRVVFVILALLRIMYLPGYVSQNRPVEGYLELRLWVIRDDNSVLFPFNMLLLKFVMSLINSNGQSPR